MKRDPFRRQFALIAGHAAVSALGAASRGVAAGPIQKGPGRDPGWFGYLRDINCRGGMFPMKRMIVPFLLCMCGCAFGAIDHRLSSRWEIITVLEMGLTFAAPRDVYGKDLVKAGGDRAYDWYLFNLFTIRFGGWLSERRPIVYANIVKMTAAQYELMVNSKYALNGVVDYGRQFHPSLRRYEDVGYDIEYYLYRVDFHCPDGGVMCVGVYRMRLPDLEKFVAEDEAMIKRIVGSMRIGEGRSQMARPKGK